MFDPKPLEHNSLPQPRALGLPELVFAFGVIAAILHVWLAGDVALAASKNLDIGPALIYLFAPVAVALVLLKIKPLARLALGYFAGIAVLVIVSTAISLIRMFAA